MRRRGRAGGRPGCQRRSRRSGRRTDRRFGCRGRRSRGGRHRRGGLESAVGQVERRWGAVHGLFNNAAIALRPGDGTVVDLDWSAWERTISVNLTGAALVLRAVIPSMIRSGGGSIVNNVSIAALVAEDGLDAYTASKGGLLALSRSVATSFADDGIRCNAICPGLVETPLAGAVLPDTASRMRQHTLLPIPGPDAIGPLVVYLLAAESRYMTGSVLTIDGGYSAR
ncbi:SDR family oxidoreductase [Pseudonocardia sp. KRD-182]|nr:SDR family oxidoreductase [Pseudonocardia oceani]MBW0107444.1 SDR family oxidoreductase [Pseudonocardia oceani]